MLFDTLSSQLYSIKVAFLEQGELAKGGKDMSKTVHHGGKVGAAGKALASKSSNKSEKSKAGTTLANHKNKCHK